MQNEFLNDAPQAAKEFGTSASGRYSIDVAPSNGFGGFDIVMKDKQAKHSSLSQGDIVIPVKYKLDDFDKIIGFEVGDGVMHDDLNNFLAHYGVKGMKWGIRKRPVKVSSDYKKTAGLRKRHPAELSNKQLKNINERINLEQNYRRLNPSSIKTGIAAVGGILATAELANRSIQFFKSPAGQAAISAGKKAVKKKV